MALRAQAHGARARRRAALSRRPRGRAGAAGGARYLRLAVARRGHAARHRRGRCGRAAGDRDRGQRRAAADRGRGERPVRAARRARRRSPRRSCGLLGDPRCGRGWATRCARRSRRVTRSRRWCRSGERCSTRCWPSATPRRRRRCSELPAGRLRMLDASPARRRPAARRDRRDRARRASPSRTIAQLAAIGIATVRDGLRWHLIERHAGALRLVRASCRMLRGRGGGRHAGHLGSAALRLAGRYRHLVARHSSTGSPPSPARRRRSVRDTHRRSAVLLPGQRDLVLRLGRRRCRLSQPVRARARLRAQGAARRAAIAAMEAILGGRSRAPVSSTADPVINVDHRSRPAVGRAAMRKAIGRRSTRAGT